MFQSSSLGSSAGTLKVAEVAIYTASYTITAPVANTGSVSNSLTATANSPGNNGDVVDVSDDGIDNDGDGLIDSEDNDEFGDPREFATKVAVNKIAEDVLNEIMTSW